MPYRYTAPNGHTEIVTDEQYATMHTKPAFRRGTFRKVAEPVKAAAPAVNKPEAKPEPKEETAKPDK